MTHGRFEAQAEVLLGVEVAVGDPADPAAQLFENGVTVVVDRLRIGVGVRLTIGLDLLDEIGMKNGYLLHLSGSFSHPLGNGRRSLISMEYAPPFGAQPPRGSGSFSRKNVARFLNSSRPRK